MAAIVQTAKQISRRLYTPGCERDIVALLNRAFTHWGDQGLWNWKHSQRPGFTGRDVIAYADEGRVVACLHLAIQPLVLEPGLTMLFSNEGDLAVDPGYRRMGLMLRAHDDAKRELQAQGVLLRLGFAVRDMHDRIYRHAWGHTAIPSATVRYRKILSTRQLCLSLEPFGRRFAASWPGRRLLRRGPLVIELRIAGFEPCTLHLSNEAVRCTPGSPVRCDLQVRATYRLLSRLRGRGPGAAAALARELVTGNLILRGAVRFALRGLRAVLGR